MTRFLILMAASSLLIGWTEKEDHSDWGFYVHRLINEIAVYTLPPEMIQLFKSNIHYLVKNAVNPDKRRYAVPEEGPRHYIDLDRWVDNASPQIPREWNEAVIEFGTVLVLSVNKKDTLLRLSNENWAPILNRTEEYPSLTDLLSQNKRTILNRGYVELNGLPVADSLLAILGYTYDQPIALCDEFSEHGILPYHLVELQQRLTWAFKNGHAKEILHLCAEIGHYIADAHVPLHTTENYNGQLTGQTGIHGFWETRIPELFAEREYDLFVGRASYYEDTESMFWKIVEDSHSLVDVVLKTEKDLRNSYPKGKQFCFDVRGERVSRLACREYAHAYQTALRGMVEKQLRAAILAVGSAWYTAWVDAGSPELTFLEEESGDTEGDSLSFPTFRDHSLRKSTN